MNHRVILIAASLLAMATTRYGVCFTTPADNQKVQPPAVKQPIAPNAAVRPQQSPCLGTVTAIGPDSITISFHTYIETAVKIGPDGRPTGFVDRIIPATPPKEYKIAEPLSQGRPPLWFGDAYTYAIKDIRIGDHVSIGYTSLKDVAYCEMICIFRRPGGKIPPAPGERADATNPWHKVQQARVDLEEKGERLPKNATSNQVREVAPPPREVVPPIPPAKP